METEKEHNTFFSNAWGKGMRLIPQKHSLVFIKCFFLALRENKEKSKYSK